MSQNLQQAAQELEIAINRADGELHSPESARILFDAAVAVKKALDEAKVGVGEIRMSDYSSVVIECDDISLKYDKSVKGTCYFSPTKDGG